MSSCLRINRQYVNITVDSETHDISGYTEIEIVATGDDPAQVLFLNAQQMKITDVRIEGESIPYQHIDSHKAFECFTGKPVRDALHFASLCKVVLESPDLVIPFHHTLPLSVRIDFEVNHDSTAIIRKEGVIFTDNKADGSSSWFPCLDSMTQRSLFTFVITYDSNLVGIGPGDFTLIATDANAHTNTMQYKINFPVSPSAIGFSLGPFNTFLLGDSTDSVGYFLNDSETFQNTLKPTQEIFTQVLDIFSYDAPLFSQISYVSLPFIAEPHILPGVFFIPPQMMSPIGNINVIPTVIPMLIEAIISQFVLFLFPVPSPKDKWVQTGFIALLTDIIAEKLYTTSFRFDRRWNDLNFLMAEDIHQDIYLKAIDPATGDAYNDEYLKVKAKLLMNMITQSMNNGDIQLIMLVRPLLKLSETSYGFRTDEFFSNLNKFCPNINFKIFNEQWLEANGFPIFTYNLQVDKRNRTGKLVLFQQPSTKSKIQFWTGHMVVQLMDMEQPHTTYFSIENQLQMQPLTYYAKTYKKKKTEYKFQNLTTMTVSLYHPVLWVVLDPKPTWVCKCRFRLPEFMLHHQIQLRRDAFTQHQMISALEDYANTDTTLEKLKDLLGNNMYYYGVRCHAARALAKYNSETNDDKHYKILNDWYKKEFLDEMEEPKPHDFHDVPRHYVQLEVIKALSIIRNNENYTPRTIVDLLLKIIGKANNTGNMYNDDFFNSEVELALGRIKPDIETKYKDAERIITDKLGLHASVPSFCNIISSSGYTALTAMALKTNNVVPNTNEMREFVFQGSFYYECRATVFKCLLYLALVQRGEATFADLFSDIKRLLDNQDYIVASLCLKEIYKFIYNSPYENSEDKFSAYLLSIPSKYDKDTIINRMVFGDKALEIAETIWHIMTKCARNYRRLRSEALRVYISFYGKGIPDPFKQVLATEPELEYDFVIKQQQFGKNKFLICDKRSNQTSVYIPKPTPRPAIIEAPDVPKPPHFDEPPKPYIQPMRPQIPADLHPKPNAQPMRPHLPDTIPLSSPQSEANLVQYKYEQTIKSPPVQPPTTVPVTKPNFINSRPNDLRLHSPPPQSTRNILPQRNMSPPPVQRTQKQRFPEPPRKEEKKPEENSAKAMSPSQRVIPDSTPARPTLPPFGPDRPTIPNATPAVPILPDFNNDKPKQPNASPARAAFPDFQAEKPKQPIATPARSTFPKPNATPAIPEIPTDIPVVTKPEKIEQKEEPPKPPPNYSASYGYKGGLSQGIMRPLAKAEAFKDESAKIGKKSPAQHADNRTSPINHDDDRRQQKDERSKYPPPSKEEKIRTTLPRDDRSKPDLQRSLAKEERPKYDQQRSQRSPNPLDERARPDDKHRQRPPVPRDDKSRYPPPTPARDEKQRSPIPRDDRSKPDFQRSPARDERQKYDPQRSQRSPNPIEERSQEKQRSPIPRDDKPRYPPSAPTRDEKQRSPAREDKPKYPPSAPIRDEKQRSPLPRDDKPKHPPAAPIREEKPRSPARDEKPKYPPATPVREERQRSPKEEDRKKEKIKFPPPTPVEERERTVVHLSRPVEKDKDKDKERVAQKGPYAQNKKAVPEPPKEVLQPVGSKSSQQLRRGQKGPSPKNAAAGKSPNPQFKQTAPPPPKPEPVKQEVTPQNSRQRISIRRPSENDMSKVIPKAPEAPQVAGEPVEDKTQATPRISLKGPKPLKRTSSRICIRAPSASSEQSHNQEPNKASTTEQKASSPVAHKGPAPQTTDQKGPANPPASQPVASATPRMARKGPQASKIGNVGKKGPQAPIPQKGPHGVLAHKGQPPPYSPPSSSVTSPPPKEEQEPVLSPPAIRQLVPAIKKKTPEGKAPIPISSSSSRAAPQQQQNQNKDQKPKEQNGQRNEQSQNTQRSDSSQKQKEGRNEPKKQQHKPEQRKEQMPDQRKDKQMPKDNRNKNEPKSDKKNEPKRQGSSEKNRHKDRDRDRDRERDRDRDRDKRDRDRDRDRERDRDRDRDRDYRSRDYDRYHDGPRSYEYDRGYDSRHERRYDGGHRDYEKKRMLPSPQSKPELAPKIKQKVRASPSFDRPKPQHATPAHPQPPTQ